MGVINCGYFREKRVVKKKKNYNWKLLFKNDSLKQLYFYRILQSHFGTPCMWLWITPVIAELRLWQWQCKRCSFSKLVADSISSRSPDDSLTCQDSQLKTRLVFSQPIFNQPVSVDVKAFVSTFLCLCHISECVKHRNHSCQLRPRSLITYFRTNTNK